MIAVQLDLRLPLGLLFTLLGATLAGAGVVGRAEVQGLNINLWWGAVLIVFGTGSLWMAWRRRVGPRPHPGRTG